MRVKDPDIGSPAKKSLSSVTDIEVVDSHTVKMKLNTSFADFPLLLTDYRLRMIPSGSGDTIGKTGIGTGPFIVEKFDAEGTTILKANPDYWEGAPKLAEVHVIAIPDGQARIQALLTGQIDMNRYVPFNQKKIFDGNSKFNVSVIPTGNWRGMVMRTDTAPFDNPKVRKAVRMAVDRQELVDLVMGGAATVLGLALMLLEAQLDIRLRVLIPAVENSISSSAFRPQDILKSRKGLTVEINNTDAEGRLILADAISLADEEAPELLICMATLTGAARIALGSDIAPFYTDNDDYIVKEVEDFDVDYTYSCVNNEVVKTKFTPSAEESKEYERIISDRRRHYHHHSVHNSTIISHKKKAETHRHATEETKKKVNKQTKHFKSQRYNMRCERSRHEHNSKTYTKEVTIEEN